MQKRNKSIVIVLLVAMLILAFPLQAFGLEFVDVPITASYYKAVDKLSNVGVIYGRGDGAFAPGDKTTRAEFCAFLARANGYNANYYEPKKLPFPDVNESYWAYPYISFCYENGYINGMDDGTFCPANYVTDEQAIKMVVCSSGVGNENLSKVGPKWYSGYVNVAQKYNLLNGTKLQISNSANRAFVAQVVYNAMLVTGGTGTGVQDAVHVGNSGNRPTPAPETPQEEPETNVKQDQEIGKKPESNTGSVSDKKENSGDTESKPVKKPVKKPIKKDGKFLIVLDPGHNYDTTDTGAVGNGLREQDVTYRIAEKVKPLLEKNGFLVIMTRNKLTDNVSVESVSASLMARCDIANEAGADLFLSIHCNAGGGNGTETYYYTDSEEGEVLAQVIQDHVVDAVGLYDRGIKSAGFMVLGYTNMVAALLETGFIDDAADAKKLGDESRQYDFAEGIAKGICEYFDKTYQG